MRFALDLSPSRFEPVHRDLVAEARWAEAAGFHGISLADHLVPYPPASPLDLPLPDVWVALGALAGVTRRVALVPLVCNAALHHPVRLAKMAASLDVLSGGRGVFGIGAGGHRPEEVAMGPLLTWNERLKRLGESIAAVRRLWSGQPVDFVGEHFRFASLTSRPTPQRPMPVLVGGQSAGVLEIAARHADAVNFAFVSTRHAAELSAALQRRCESVGRDPATIEFTLFERVFLGADTAAARTKWRRLGKPTVRGHPGIVGGTGEVAEQIERLSEIGVGTVFVTFADADSREAFADRILPLYAGRGEQVDA